jgi:hypothetical protein
MNRVVIIVLALCTMSCASATAPAPTGGDKYIGLTQAQLAAKLGFPLRVYTLPAKAQGGPGILFWVYYERRPSGAIEEREFVFQYSPLKVCATPAEFTPSRFLSLEKDPDFQYIYRYNAEHGR